MSADSVYSQYPGNPDQYPKGTPQEYPFPSQYFSGYSEGQIIAESSNKDPEAALIVTSGKLYSETYEDRQQAFTSTHNFRMLFNGMDTAGKRVGWTNSIVNTYLTPVVKQPNQPSWAGMHLFSRYVTSNDLYVGSFRFDGQVTIKKKIGGKYTTLGQSKVDRPVLGQKYKLQFTTNGDTLSFYVDGSKKVSVNDSSLAWGTGGLRVDYTDCYVESMRMTSPKVSDDYNTVGSLGTPSTTVLLVDGSEDFTDEMSERSEDTSDSDHSSECDLTGDFVELESISSNVTNKFSEIYNYVYSLFST